MEAVLNTTDTIGAEVEDKDLINSLERSIDISGSYVLPITGSVGIIFNTLTMFVVIYMGLDTSSVVYMLLIAIGDSISVFIDSIVNMGFTHWGLVTVLTRDDMFCKVGQWVSYFTTFATQYVLALFTFDRFLAVWKPIMYKQKLRNNLWYPVKATVVTYLVTILLLSGNLYVFSLEGGACLFGSYLSVVAQSFYFHYSVSFLYCGLPALSLFLLNLGIISKLRNMKSRSAAGNQSGRENSLTMGLLMVSFCYLFLTLIGTINLWVLTTQIQPRISDTDRKWELIATAMFYFAEWIGMLNQCINFFLYVLGSRSFRKEFVKMMCSYGKKESGKVTTTTAG